MPADHGLQMARRGLEAVQRVVQQRRAHGRIPAPPKSSPALKTSFIESMFTGMIKNTLPCSTSKNNSRMLSTNIDALIMIKSKLQVLLLRIAQQRKCLPDCETEDSGISDELLLFNDLQRVRLKKTTCEASIHIGRSTSLHDVEPNTRTTFNARK